MRKRNGAPSGGRRARVCVRPRMRRSIRPRRRRPTRARGSGRGWRSLDTLRRLDQLFRIDFFAGFRRAIFVVMRDHQAVALKISAARHRSLDDHANAFPKHLRRHAVRFDMNDRAAIGDVEVEHRSVSHVHGTGSDLAAEPNRRAIRFIAGVRDVAWRPVVDKIAADATARDDGETDRGDGECREQNDLGTLHRDFLCRTNSETPYAVRTSAVQPYAAITNDHPPVRYPPVTQALPRDPAVAAAQVRQRVVVMRFATATR